MTTNPEAPESPESPEPPEPVWVPDPAEAQRSILAAFTRWVEREHAVDLPGYNALWQTARTAGPVPQFSLGKSYPGFAPLGPALVTVDELGHPDDLELGCRLGDEVLQLGRTRDLMFSVPELISELSAVCPLLPGDVIFTGTPSGVGNARDPKRFIPPGAVLTSHIEGIGELRNEFVAGPRYENENPEGGD